MSPKRYPVAIKLDIEKAYESMTPLVGIEKAYESMTPLVGTSFVSSSLILG